MRRWWVVARFEFLSNIRRWEFLLLTVGLPIFAALILAAAFFPNAIYLQHKLDRSEPVGVGWVDESGRFTFPAVYRMEGGLDTRSSGDVLNGAPPSLSGVFRFVHFSSPEEARKQLLANQVEFVYIIHKDYVQTAAVDVMTVNRSLFPALRTPPIRMLLQQGLLGDRVDKDLLGRVTDPMHANAITLTPDGQLITNQLQQTITDFFLPYGLMMLLLMSLLGSSSYLLRSLSEEKENRIMEILLAAVTPQDLFYGKILGLGLLGLVQLGFWLVFSLPMVGLAVSYLHIPPSAFFFFLIYFGLGYTLFAGLIAGVGAIGSTEKESNQILGIFFLLQVVPMMLMPIILDDLNGTIARVFSLVPFTAPMVMMVRCVRETPPIQDVVLSIASMALAIWIVYRMGLKVFRMGLLMYGKSPSVRELLGWLKEA